MDRKRSGVSRRRILAGAAGGAVLAGSTVGSGEGETADVDPGLREVSGTVDVIVRLAEPEAADGGVPTDRPLEAQKRRVADRGARFRAAVANRDGVEVGREFWLANAVLAWVDTDAVALAELAALDVVAGIEENRVVEPPRADVVEGSDPEATTDSVAPRDATERGDGGDFTDGVAQEAAHHLEGVNAPIVWEFYGTRGEGVDVGVIGTGVDPAGHDGIRESLERGGWAEFDEAGERVDSEPNDPEGHGTGVSGVVVGETTDDGVQYGVAPDANLYHARRARSFASTFAAFDWVVENGVDVLSLSWGPLGYSPTFVRGVRNVQAAGTLVVGSVGNAGRYTSATPGNHPTTVGVGAVDRDGAVPEWSGGEEIDTPRYWGGIAPDDWPETYTVPDVTAPGVDVPFAEPGGGYQNRGGTSVSTPLAAGVAALVVAATDATGADVGDLLVEAARHPAAGERFQVDPGQDDRHGAGILDAMAAASLANATESITGRVTDPDGEPIAGVVVGSETGARTTTDGDGRFSLQLPPGEQPVGAVALGYEVAFEVFDPAERDSLDLTMRPTDAPDCDLRDGLPTRIDPGGTMTATFAVANVRTVSVTTDITGPLTEEHLSLTVDGRAAEFGDGVAYEEPRDDDALTISVEAASDAPPGQVQLPVYVGGDGDPVTGVLETVYVHPDPLPIDPQIPSIQAVVDLVAPDTVVTLASGAYEETADGEASDALVLDKPVSLVAAEGESPRVVVGDGDLRSAVSVSANDVKLAKLQVDAGGTEAAVRAGVGFQDRATVAPSGLTVRDNELGGGTDGVVADWAPAMWVENNAVTADRVGIDVRDQQRTAVRDNEISGTETGVRVGGVAEEVSGNEIRDVEGAAIHVETPELYVRRMGPIVGNEIDGAETGILVSGYTAGPISDNRISNVTGAAIGVTGRASGPIRANVIDGASVGLDVREGVVDGSVEDNEFRNVDTERQGDPNQPSGTPGPGGTAGTDVGGDLPEDSALDLVLYGATALATGTLFLPYGLRRFRRR